MTKRPQDMPATYSSNVSISANPAGVKITFGETGETEKEINYHTAVFMPTPIAEAFQKLLKELLEKADPNKAQNKPMKSPIVMPPKN